VNPVEDWRESIEEQLRTHRANLHDLEEKKAELGSSTPPAINRQIENERASIDRLEQTLASLDVQSTMIIEGDNNPRQRAYLMDQMDRLLKLEAKLDQIKQDLNAMATQLALQQQQIERMREDMRELQVQVSRVNNEPMLNPFIIVGGTLFLLAILILLILITWRVF